MIGLLNSCNTYLANNVCCHDDARICDCYQCLRGGFYGMPDHYDCRKKLCYYVLNYGPSYASEIYHYLGASGILETFVPRGRVNILSLGCGFCPDLIAIDKYIQNNNLLLQVNYTGIDASDCWQPSRYVNDSSIFYTRDVSADLELTGFDIVFVVKLFSTLYQNNRHIQFLQRLKNSVEHELTDGSYLVFNDVNSIHKGRDVFHNQVSRNFTGVRQYYFADPPHAEANWLHIQPQQQIMFNIPVNLAVAPMRQLNKTVVFEYRK